MITSPVRLGVELIWRTYEISRYALADASGQAKILDGIH